MNLTILFFFVESNVLAFRMNAQPSLISDDFQGDWGIPQPVIFEIWLKGKFSKMSKLGQVYTAGQFVKQ